MSIYGVPVGFSVRKVVVLSSCVALVAMSATWAFLSMRAVMAVGGSCADGGPYVSAQPCPPGGGLIGLAIPVLVLATLGGSAAAAALSAPLLLVPMWAVLFGSLGWNFLEAGFTGPAPVGGWIICGVMFELMAAPAVVVWGLTLAGRPTVMDSRAAQPSEATPVEPLQWWSIYVALSVAGAVLGVLSFRAIT